MDLTITARAATDANGEVHGARRALWTMFGQACNAAALAHVVFLVLFANLGLSLLVWTNMASIALFLGCRVLLLRRRNTLVVSLVAGEVVVHATLASGLLGWDSGFHYYLLSLIGPFAVGMNGSSFSKFLRLMAFGVGYAALDAWTRQMPPVYRVAPALLDSMRYFNVAGMMAIMAFVSLTYYRLVTSAEKALRRQASTDPLTGLHNRRHLLEIVRSTRSADPLTPHLFLLLCDVDNFKDINDRHGHETGDMVLESVARAIKAAVRTTDSVARWGGEEFVVLLPGADSASATQTGERVRAAVAALQLPRSSLAITITIGVAQVDPGDTIDAAIARADAALYRGKAAGRNRVVVDV